MHWNMQYEYYTYALQYAIWNINTMHMMHYNMQYTYYAYKIWNINFIHVKYKLYAYSTPSPPIKKHFKVKTN